MSKVRLATVWLDGCSGCHMSIMDLDEVLIDIAPLIDLVYSPIVDAKEFPENVDICLVEGAVSSEEDLEKIHLIRRNTKTLVSLGDCAVTANVPSMRNPFEVNQILQRVYIENASLNNQIPKEVVPRLLPRSRPVHEIVNVDLYVPGCPPSPDLIKYVLTEFLEGRVPDVSTMARFGA